MLELDSKKRLEDIRLIIKDLLKVVKVVSLYPESNPLPQSLRRSFSEKFESIIDDYGDIKLIINKESLVHADETVYSGHDGDESLVSLLFDAGILTITFKDGLDVIEINRFLDIIKTGINTPGQEFDLVNKLWEADLSNISLTTAEDIALAAYDGDLNIQEINLADRQERSRDDLPPGFQAIFTDDGDETPSDMYIEVNQADLADFDESDFVEAGDYANWTPDEGDSGGTPVTGPAPSSGGQGPVTGVKRLVRRGRPGTQAGRSAKPQSVLSMPGVSEEQMKTMEAAAAMGFGGSVSPSPTPVPDTTMILNDQFQLTEEEQTEIDHILDDDANFDPWESTAELVCEILHQEEEMNAFFETVGVVEKVIGELIYNARLAEADRVIQYLGKLRDQIMIEKPLWSERLRDAIVMSGSKERLTVLALSLNSHPNITPNAIKRYLSRFGWESLGPITDMLPQLTHDAHREAVRTHLASLGGRNIQIISNGIYDKRSHVIKGAIQVLSGIADLQVLKHLQKAAEHRDIDVRLELAQALKNSPLEQTIEILITLAQDKQEEVRREAVNVIVQRRGQAAFDAIAELIHAEDFGIQTHDDRLSLLIAYTKLGSEHAVELLRKLATQWNPLLLRLLERIREEAFEALAHNQSDKAARLLIKLTGSWRPRIKELAIKATHQRRIIIYGGDNVDND